MRRIRPIICNSQTHAIPAKQILPQIPTRRTFSNAHFAESITHHSAKVSSCVWEYSCIVQASLAHVDGIMLRCQTWGSLKLGEVAMTQSRRGVQEVRLTRPEGEMVSKQLMLSVVVERGGSSEVEGLVRLKGWGVVSEIVLLGRSNERLGS